MKKITNALVCLCLALAVTACSKPAHMAKYYDLVETSCNPQVLEVLADNIKATYTMNFPEGYFHPKAVLEVTPVLVYNGQETAATPIKLQGEKITDNYTVIANAGGAASHTINFPYQPGMEKSELKLRCTVFDGDKAFPFPADYKVADGANITYKLVCLQGTPALAPHNYQKVIEEKQEAQILYKINSSEVRNSELTKAEIKEFQNFLAALAQDERRTVTGTDIVAYASPDGAETLNNKLSDKRSASAEKAYDKVTKKVRPEGEVNVRSIGEDWEGFQELVNASNVADKELILRVLGMYSDPAVREREIKNMSAVYKTLADKVLPALRRARFITNIEFANYTEEELVELVKNDIELLDENALLYAATLVQDKETVGKLYQKAADKFNSARGYNNLACWYLDQNKNEEAAKALAKADAKCPMTQNNQAVLALRKGDYKKAAEILAALELPEAVANKAALDILNGDYAAAVKKLEGTQGINTALAHILNEQYNKAEKALNCECAKAAYLRAVIAARQGKAKEVAKQLAVVKEKSEELWKRSQTDIEFAKYR